MADDGGTRRRGAPRPDSNRDEAHRDGTGSSSWLDHDVDQVSVRPTPIRQAGEGHGAAGMEGGVSMSDDGAGSGKRSSQDARPIGVDDSDAAGPTGEVRLADGDDSGGTRRTIAINDGELGERLSTPGSGPDLRPAISPTHLAAVHDSPDAPPAFLAVDLGTTRLSAGIVSIDGEVVVRDRVATPQRSVWPAVTQLVHRVIAANKTELRPRWCGVTCPGPIDQENGVMMPIGLPVWKDFPLRNELSHHVGLPVAIDTHGRGLALADQWLGASAGRPAGEQHFATLVISDEVSGGLVDGGVLMNGKTGNLGGFGHISVEPEGVPCPCGGAGCLVMYASVGAIEADTGRDLPRTPPAIIERSAIMVARALASIAAMVDVSEVVVAGVVAEVFGQPFYDALDLELNDRSRLRHLEQLIVRPAAGTLGPLVSAAAIARTLVGESVGLEVASAAN